MFYNFLLFFHQTLSILRFSIFNFCQLSFLQLSDILLFVFCTVFFLVLSNDNFSFYFMFSFTRIVILGLLIVTVHFNGFRGRLERWSGSVKTVRGSGLGLVAMSFRQIESVNIRESETNDKRGHVTVALSCGMTEHIPPFRILLGRGSERALRRDSFKAWRRIIGRAGRRAAPAPSPSGCAFGP